MASYFGMRKIECRDGIFYLNGKVVFQRLVLDQGFYPDGIYTASTLSELEADIDRSVAMGFNGARLHQKVFEPLFLSLCDRKGYIVWGEHANWCLDISRDAAYRNFLPEWCEIMARDFNHPAIIGWCPLNETQPNQDRQFVRFLATVTRQYDTTRMYIDASGWVHIAGLTDIMDLHDYEQNPEVFAGKLEPLKEGGTYDVHWLNPSLSMPEHPTFVSEYGGIRWAPAEDAGWGYGQAPMSEVYCSRSRPASSRSMCFLTLLKKSFISGCQSFCGTLRPLKADSSDQFCAGVKLVAAEEKENVLPRLVSTREEMKIFAPRESVIVFKVQAQIRIIMAGTIALKPSGMDSMHCLKVITLLHTK